MVEGWMVVWLKVGWLKVVREAWPLAKVVWLKVVREAWPLAKVGWLNG